MRSLRWYRRDLKVFGCDISKNAISAARMCNDDIGHVIADGQGLPFTTCLNLDSTKCKLVKFFSARVFPAKKLVASPSTW